MPLFPPVVGFASPKADSLAAQPTTTSPVVHTRPAISSFSSSGTGFGEGLKAGSSWQCDTCLLQNKGTDNKCVACQATKLLPKDSAKQPFPSAEDLLDTGMELGSSCIVGRLPFKGS